MFDYYYSPFWILKLNNIGKNIWQKVYGWGERGSIHRPYSIQQTSDGGYIVAGISEHFDRQMLILKLDNIGNIVWQKRLAGGDWGFWGFAANSIQETSDGGYIVAGAYVYLMEEHLIWVIKLDSNGDMVWKKTFGEAGINEAYSIQQTIDGGYILGGRLKVVYTLLLKLDSDGNTLWGKTYGKGYGAYDVKQTFDGGYIITDGSKLIKTDVNGEVEWGKEVEGTCLSLQQCTDGGYVAACNTLQNNTDVLILKLDSTGEIPDCSIINTATITVVEENLTGVEQGCDGEVQCISRYTSVISRKSSAIVNTICPSDSDDDGVLNEVDNCPNTPNPN